MAHRMDGFKGLFFLSSIYFCHARYPERIRQAKPKKKGLFG
jgi:hypothetical protein